MAQPMRRFNALSVGDRGTTLTPAAPAPSASATMMKKTDDVTESVGGGMKSLAGSLRQQAPSGGTVGQMAAGAAHALEQTGEYLQKEGMSGLMDDALDMVRTYPLQSVLVCLGAGFLMAQTLGRR